MSNAALASEDHHHHFKIKWKIVGDDLVIHPVCQCSGCEMRVMIKQVAGRIVATFIGSGTPVRYTVALMEEA